MHELGHSFGGLADEYFYANDAYNGPEPGQPNVSINGDAGDPNHKWAHWMGYEQAGIGEIGTYEGGRYHAEGIFRPSDNFKMRSLGRAFDAVSREQLILKIYEQVDPLDEWTDTAETVVNAALEALRVDRR